MSFAEAILFIVVPQAEAWGVLERIDIRLNAQDICKAKWRKRNTQIQ